MPDNTCKYNESFTSDEVKHSSTLNQLHHSVSSASVSRRKFDCSQQAATYIYPRSIMTSSALHGLLPNRPAGSHSVKIQGQGTEACLKCQLGVAKLMTDRINGKLTPMIRPDYHPIPDLHVAPDICIRNVTSTWML
jgi:hypothetical protein